MARQFADVLRELHGGSFYDDLTGALAEVVEACQETRKPGSLTIKLSVKPNGENTVFMHGDHVAKVPERAKGDTLFFTTADGGLVRNDPRQGDLPLREVKETQRPLKEVAGGE